MHGEATREQFLPHSCGGYTPSESARHGNGDQRRTAGVSGHATPIRESSGVIEEGALADLLLVEGNPLENIDLVTDPANSFKTS